MLEISETMTTDEYLKKKEQENIDKLFNEAILQAELKSNNLQKEMDKEKQFQNLIRQLADIEGELGISIELYNKYKNSPSKTADEIKAMEQDIKTYKQKHTKISNQIDKYIKEETKNG